MSPLIKLKFYYRLFIGYIMMITTQTKRLTGGKKISREILANSALLDSSCEEKKSYSFLLTVNIPISLEFALLFNTIR